VSNRKPRPRGLYLLLLCGLACRPAASPEVPVDTEVPSISTDVPVDDSQIDTEATDTETVDTEPTDTESIDTEPPDTESVDTDAPDTVLIDTDPVDTDPPGPPTRPAIAPRSFVEIGASQLCTSADPCQGGWINQQGYPDADHTMSCTVGGYDGPGDTTTVCLFDIVHDSGRRGHLARYRPVDGGWTDLGDFETLGVLPAVWADRPNGWTGFIDIDADGQTELIAMVPGGPLFRKVGDQWSSDTPLQDARASTGANATGYPGIADVDLDGRLDLVVYSSDGTVWIFYQTPAGTWEARSPVTRIAGVNSNAYDWVFHRDASGDLTITATGSRLGNFDATMVYETTGVDTDGRPLFTEVAFAYLPEPMGAALVDLDRSGTPHLVFNGSDPTSCPRVFRDMGGSWFDVSALAMLRLPNAMCGTPTDATLSYLPWHVVNVDDGLVLSLTGDDARYYNGSCATDPTCPNGPVEPIVAYFPDRDAQRLVAMDAAEIDFVDLQGLDQRQGNRRWARCWDIDQDGDADCGFSGVFMEHPQLFLQQATGPRTCARLRGNGVTVPANGGMAVVQLQTDGRTWHAWPNASMSQGDEMCAHIETGPLQIEVRWPDGTISQHTWAIGDAPYWDLVQP
jgi:hypothetical protein